MNTKIGVISDIHSNAISLEIVLEKLLEEKIDLCIVLGDLLTYGTQPNEVIELLIDFRMKVNCIFIKGNHDQFYFDISNGIDPIKYKMAEFVKESIFWTKDKLKYDLYKTFEWHDNFIIDKIFFAHANPFNYGNWKYLNGEEDIKMAVDILSKKDMSVGIFGHTHRNKKYIIHNDFIDCVTTLSGEFKFNEEQQLILNSGSIGQPRGSYPGFIILYIMDDSMTYNDIKIDLDNKLLIKKTSMTNLSLDTKNKINSFWEIDND